MIHPPPSADFRILSGDIAVFVLFTVAVVAVGLYKSRGKSSGEDYFLAGRGLTWWLVGLSLIASNISTEQFVGMSGNAASHVGLAIASYEWMAAIVLVVIAFGFLPRFLRAGIYTMPEFLEQRFNGATRTFMAVFTLLIYILLFGAVTYSGALTITTLAQPAGYAIGLPAASLVIGLLAMACVTTGGLKACAWADLIQGVALIVGGGLILFFALGKLGAASTASMIADPLTGAVISQPLSSDQGALARFVALNAPRLNMFLPATDPIFPWTALLFSAWIGHFYYWGLNQYITQRTLGSASLAEGQKGIMFAAGLKLVLPFLIVIPGMIAFNLYAPEMRQAAAGHTALTAAQYLKANPATQYVAAVETWAEATARPGEAGTYLLVLDDSAPPVPAEAVSRGLLSISRTEFAALPVPAYTVFVTEDRAWAHLHPGLAAEIADYNRATEARALAAKTGVSREKFIAFKYDTALAQLLAHVLPSGMGIVGFVLAALLGAVVSSLAAILNAASTIFTIDIFQRHLAPRASTRTMVRVGQVSTLAFTACSILLAPQLGNPRISNSIFMIIQESESFISPGILAVFLFGFAVRRAPAACGLVGLVANVASCSVLKFAAPHLQFMHRMGIGFCVSLAAMALVTCLLPQRAPAVSAAPAPVDLTSSRGAKFAGALVIVLTIALYAVFSPWGPFRSP